ncbi:hypothetical protein [Clostridium sp.]|uniref:hypothetical protein n=1 Tax=Clostridium sp. TaxID=1506 RepID=UPI00359FE580
MDDNFYFFKPIYSVDFKYLAQCSEIVLLFNKAIDETFTLDLQKIRDLINQRPNMSIIGITNKSIVQHSIEVHHMIDILFNNLIQNNVKNILVKKQSNLYRNAVENAFININEKNKYIHFLKNKEYKYKITYKYNFLFIFQNKLTGILLQILFVGLTITVGDIEKKLLSVRDKDKKYYKIFINSIEIIEPLKE